jgi:hypothetical protein
MFWGHLNNLEPKGKGKNSISEKRIKLRAVRVDAPRDLRHRVKAGLPEV